MYSNSTSEQLWKEFKDNILKSIEENIPQKTITNKKKLPWVDNKLKLKINKTKRLYGKRKNSPEQMQKYKKTKKSLQQDMRKAYWKYIENMIFDLPVQEPEDNTRKKKQPKNLFTYIKCMKNDNTGIAALKKMAY